MKTVQSKGAGSPKLPRCRASRLGRAPERSRLAYRTSGKAQTEAIAPGCSLPSLSTASFPREPLPPPKIEHLPSHNYTETAETKVQAPESSSEPLASPVTAFSSGSLFLLRASSIYTLPCPDLNRVTASSELRSFSEPGPSNGAPEKGCAKFVLERQKAGSLKNWRLCALESSGEALDKSRDSVWRPVWGTRTVGLVEGGRLD